MRASNLRSRLLAVAVTLLFASGFWLQDARATAGLTAGPIKGGTSSVNAASGGARTFGQDQTAAATSTGAHPNRPRPAASSASDDYQQTVLSNRPLAYYRLSETAGTIVVDSSGNGQNGTYTRPDITTNNIPGALENSSDGAVAFGWTLDPIVTTPGSDLPSGNSARTVEEWVQSSDSANTNSLIYGDFQGGNGWGISNFYNGAGGLDVSTGGTCTFGATCARFAMPYSVNFGHGEWHLLDVAYDGIGSVSGYLDGQLLGTQPLTQVNTTVPGQGLSLSGDRGTYLDEVAVYGTALTSDQIGLRWTLARSPATVATACAIAPSTPYSATIRADHPSGYWRLGDSGGLGKDAVAFDSSGNCHNGAYAPWVIATSGATADGNGAIEFPGCCPPGAGVLQSGTGLPAGGAARTVEEWVNANGVRSGAPFAVSYGDFASGNGFEIQVLDGSDLLVQTILDRGQCQFGLNCAIWNFNGAFSLNQWHLLDVTFDGTTAIGYLDGVAIGTQAMSSLSTRVPGQGLDLTSSSYSTSDEVAIYPSALSALRIATHYVAASIVPALPTVTGVSPNQGFTYGGTQVAIAGTNFTSDATVTFGATTAAKLTVNSSTSITATSPPGVAGTVDVEVATSAGSSATSTLDRFMYVAPPLPGKPIITSVRGTNRGASVTWQPPADTGGSPIRSYTVIATPYANSDHFAPQVQAVSTIVSGTSASFSNLVADCHQEYTFTVAATNSAVTGPPSTPSSPVKSSGYVSGPPPVVEILIDGEGSAINSSYPTFDPLAVPSYCAEAGQNPPVATNFSAFPLLNDPTVRNWTTGANSPQFVSGGGLAPSHHYLTDAVAALGGLVLPYSYAGAHMLKKGYFEFTSYSGSLSATQALQPDVQHLRSEVASIHATWRGTHIILVGHSWGGVIAEEFWKTTNFASLGVVRVFSLDSPINGTARAGQCYALHIESACSAVVAFFDPGNPIGKHLVKEMGYRWVNLQPLDQVIIGRDQDFSYVDIGTRGDPTYTDVRTNGTFDSFIPQLVMSTCDNSLPSNQCTASHPPSFGTNCTADGGSPWEPLGHDGVRSCPDTADLIGQAVAAISRSPAAALRSFQASRH